MSPALAIGLALADLATTLVGVRMVGPEGEVNPWYRAVLRRYGAGGFCVVYLGVWTALIGVATLDRYLMVGLTAALALIVLNNLVALARLRRR
jgi:hypothetical protein